jgi:hypothetical protein
MRFQVKRIAITLVLVAVALGAVYVGVYCGAVYVKAQAIRQTETAVENKVKEAVDSERIQNYLKDHCAKHPDHVRCAAIR